jgi:alpha-L-fucosidase
MTFAILTAKHESGFCLWDSPDYDYNVASSPFKGDLIRDFVTACKAGGLVPGVHYSISDDYNEASHKGEVSPPYFAVIKKHITELVTKYPDLRVLIVDDFRRLSSAQSDELRRLVERLNPRCAVWDCEGVEGLHHIAATVIRSWMWAPNPRLNSAPGLLNRYKKAQTAGKAFILNVGPDTTGQISSEQQAVLMDLKKLIANEAANSAPAP